MLIVGTFLPTIASFMVFVVLEVCYALFLVGALVTVVPNRCCLC